MEDKGKRTLSLVFEAGIMGKRRAISKSNMRNSMATKKNRNENGRRAELIGSNPHSYGDAFSNSRERFGKKCPTIRRRRERKMAREKKIKSFICLKFCYLYKERRSGRMLLRLT